MEGETENAGGRNGEEVVMDIAKGVDNGKVETHMLKAAPKYGNWQTKEQRHRGTEESVC